MRFSLGIIWEMWLWHISTSPCFNKHGCEIRSSPQSCHKLRGTPIGRWCGAFVIFVEGVNGKCYSMVVSLFCVIHHRNWARPSVDWFMWSIQGCTGVFMEISLYFRGHKAPVLSLEKPHGTPVCFHCLFEWIFLASISSTLISQALHRRVHYWFKMYGVFPFLVKSIRMNVTNSSLTRLR